MHPRFLPKLALSSVALLGACVGRVGPDYVAPRLEAARAWQASFPEAIATAHQGSARKLADWWSRFEDAALDALIDAAQKNSATLAQAAAAIERSRAETVTAEVAGLPNLDGIASYNRSALTLGGPSQRRTQSLA